MFGPKMASGKPGRYLKSLLGAVRFIVTHYGPVASHGDPIHGQIPGLMLLTEPLYYLLYAISNIMYIYIYDI